MIAMPYRRFLAANVLGGAAWAGAVILLGYSAGASLTHIQSLLSTISLVMGAGLAAAVVVGMVRARHRRGARAATHRKWSSLMANSRVWRTIAACARSQPIWRTDRHRRAG